MRNRVVFASIVFLISFSAAGQSDSTLSEISYFMSMHSGALLGKKGDGTSLTASTVHGVRYKRLRLGVGIGYDAYNEWRTLPVFASGGYDLISKREAALYVQFNTGYSRAWNPFKDEGQFIYEEEGGVFFHPLVGLRLGDGKMKMYCSAGYRIQNLTYEQTPRWMSGVRRKITVDRHMERLSVQIGIGLR